MEPTLTIVIPAYNEAKALETLLPQWLEQCQSAGWEMVVVDDGSTDQTAAVLQHFSSHPCLIAIQHKVNRGYGGALKTGIRYSRSDLTLTMDADGQHAMSDIPGMLESMRAQDADMVIGRRESQAKEGMYRKTGKLIIRNFARFLFSVTLLDLNSGFKLYKTSLVKHLLNLCPDSMAFSDVITIAHVSQKLRVVEHPIQVHPRCGGESTINTLTALQTMLEIVNLMVWFKPLKIYLPIALILMIVGIGWAIPLLIIGRGLSTVSLLLIITGIFLIMLGLLSHQLSQNRKVQLPEAGLHVLGKD